MRYSLRQLEVFLAVARTSSVSRAAESLHLSQSAVSGALRELEDQFAMTLFDRRGKRLTLSDLGRALRVKAEATWAQAVELERAFEAKEEAGTLRVGATMTIGNHVAMPLVARFLQGGSGCSVSLAVANTEEIARQVANFELDVGLVEGEVNHPALTISRWCGDELAVFASPGHPLARKRALEDADLRQAAWILREPGSGTRQTFDRALHDLLPSLNVLLTLSQTEAVKGAVAAGLGLGCLSRIALEEECRAGVLKLCDVPGRDLTRSFYVLLHRDKHESGALRRWLDICRRHPPEVARKRKAPGR